MTHWALRDSASVIDLSMKREVTGVIAAFSIVALTTIGDVSTAAAERKCISLPKKTTANNAKSIVANHLAAIGAISYQ